MSVTVVGSIAFDAVKTPFGERERMLGGSAVHFSLAASFFTDVHVVGPVGDDFGEAEYSVLQARGVDTRDISEISVTRLARTLESFRTHETEGRVARILVADDGAGGKL